MSKTFNGSGMLTSAIVTDNRGSATDITISGYTGIGEYAFANTNITKVTIGDSVLTIGGNAFRPCSQLRNVTIGNGVTYIGNDAFVFCPINKLIFGNSVQTIDRYAFYGCQFLSLTIPNTVTTINRYAFADSAIRTLIIGNLVNYIDDSVFNGCGGLATVKISNQSIITTLGPNVFTGRPSNSIVTFYNTAAVGNLSAKGVLIANQFANVVYDARPLIIPTITIGDKKVGKNNSITINPDSDSSGNITYSSNNNKVSITGNIITGVNVGVSDITLTQDTIDNYSTGTAIFEVNVVYYFCFKEGTKILTEDGYVPVEELTQQHKLKTMNGYKKVYGLRMDEIEHTCNNERIADQLYVCRKEEYPELTEELVMTGRHSILENTYKDGKQIEEVKKVLGKLCSTGDKVRVPVCIDERSKVYEVGGTYNIYHVAVENENRKINDGIYANGLLVESCSMDEI